MSATQLREPRVLLGVGGHQRTVANTRYTSTFDTPAPAVGRPRYPWVRIVCAASAATPEMAAPASAFFAVTYRAEAVQEAEDLEARVARARQDLAALKAAL